MSNAAEDRAARIHDAGTKIAAEAATLMQHANGALRPMTDALGAEVTVEDRVLYAETMLRAHLETLQKLIPRVATFWDYENEPVRLTVREGETLQRHGGGETEEGYSSWGATYRIEGVYLVREAGTDARDCDGRMTTFQVSRCRLSELQGGGQDRDNPAITYPAWEHLEGSQRDFQAEAAGY